MVFVASYCRTIYPTWRCLSVIDVARDSKKMTTWDIGRLKFFLKWDLTSDNAVRGESSREQRQKQTRNLAKICEFHSCAAVWFLLSTPSFRIGSGWCFMVDILCFMLVAYAMNLCCRRSKKKPLCACPLFVGTSRSGYGMTLCNLTLLFRFVLNNDRDSLSLKIYRRSRAYSDFF